MKQNNIGRPLVRGPQLSFPFWRPLAVGRPVTMGLLKELKNVGGASLWRFASFVHIRNLSAVTESIWAKLRKVGSWDNLYYMPTVMATFVHSTYMPL